MTKDVKRLLLPAAFLLAVGLVFALRTPPPPNDTENALLREVAAYDHVWYRLPGTGSRLYIGSGAQALEVAKRVAVEVGEEELSRIRGPLATRLFGPGEEGESWRGRFLRDPEGRYWYVDSVTTARMRVTGGLGTRRALVARARELPRPDLRQIPVSGDSPEWIAPPKGYVAEIVAGDFTRPRVLGWDPAGRLMVSEHLERGRLTALDVAEKGPFAKRVVVDGRTRGLNGLFNLHGFAFLGGRLYAAGEHLVESWGYDAKAGKIRGVSQRLLKLPSGGGGFPGEGHRTRTLVAGGDGNLYLSVGSDCDACTTSDRDALAVIKRIRPSSGAVEVVARGLRNAVFFTEDPARGKWWTNEMGVDGLGENLPPDELNAVKDGADYGWPFCYGAKKPMPGADIGRCAGTEPPVHGYPAHSAPLGIRVIPAAFNPEWDGDLLVALHGSVVRKRSVAGYKIVRVRLDPSGKPVGQEDVVTGFLKGMNIPAGRPVDLLFGQDGALYVSDDHAGVIHRIRRAP